MQALASLDHGWDAVEEYSDFRLLPEGNRTFEIVRAYGQRNARLGDRPELVVDVTSAEGGGKFEIVLAPHPNDVADPEKVAKWKRRLKTDLVRLGYEGLPSQLHTYLPQLAGAIVELTVEHVPSEKVNPNTGEAYVNQRVRLERFVRGVVTAGEAAGVTAAPAPATTDAVAALDAAFASAPSAQPPVAAYEPFG